MIFVGTRHDPQHGPVVLVGAGGVLVALMHDVAVLARHTAVFPLVPAGASVGPSDLTAIGVREAVREVARRLDRSLEGLHVALQGLGEVVLDR